MPPSLSLYLSHLSHQTHTVRVGPTPVLLAWTNGAATAATASESSEPPGQGPAYPGFLTRAGTGQTRCIRVTTGRCARYTRSFRRGSITKGGILRAHKISARMDVHHANAV